MSDDAIVSMEVNQRDLLSFESSLVEFATTFHKALPDVLRSQARLIAVNLAYNTQPYGLDENARLIGTKAVLRDVGLVYRSIDAVYARIERESVDAAKAFYAAAMRGDMAVAKHILRGCGLTEFLGAAIGPLDLDIRATLRDGRGRVRTRSPRQIVTNPRELMRLQKQLVGRVGTAKSAWASCARQLGGVRGIPYWATKNKARGTVEDLTQGNNPRVILHADVDYMPTACPPAMRRDAVEKQRGKMQTAIRLALDKSAQRLRRAA